jgi:hypothetical protein
MSVLGGVLVIAEAELLPPFGSLAELTVAVLVNVNAGGVASGMWKVTLMTALATAMLGLLQLTVPLLAPTDGAVQLKPAGALTLTNVHPPVTGSSMVTGDASGPLLVTVTLKVTSVPWGAVEGPVLEMLKSLLATCANVSGATASIAHTNAADSLGSFIFDPSAFYSRSGRKATWEIYLR